MQTEPPKYILDGPIVRRLSAEVIVDSFLSLRTRNPDASVATGFRWDGFTHFYDKSKTMTVKDFVDYSVAGPGRAAFQRREEKEAKERNAIKVPKSLWRVSTYGHRDGAHATAVLMGQSTRDLIDSANSQPDIPQILYLMNGHLEHEITQQPKAYIHRRLEHVKDPTKRMNMIWKAILSRPPKPSEQVLFNNPQEDIIWALLNSNEFKFIK